MCVSVAMGILELIQFEYFFCLQSSFAVKSFNLHVRVVGHSTATYHRKQVVRKKEGCPMGVSTVLTISASLTIP